MVETMASENRMADAIKVMESAVDEASPSARTCKLALANMYVRD